MSVRVIEGDCMRRLRELPDESVDCIITDPPYGATSFRWDKWPTGWPTECARVLKPTGSMWVFGMMRVFLNHADEFAGWKFAQDVVWEKQNGTGIANDRFRRVHEIVCQFYRETDKWGEIYRKPQYTHDAKARVVNRGSRPAGWQGKTGPTSYVSTDGGPRLMRSVIFERNEHYRSLHPTQKPIPVIGPLLLYSCPPGGVVLDPFAGSGSVGIAARIHEMSAILIEANEEHASVIRQRLHDDAPLLQAAFREA